MTQRSEPVWYVAARAPAATVRGVRAKLPERDALRSELAAIQAAEADATAKGPPEGDAARRVANGRARAAVIEARLAQLAELSGEAASDEVPDLIDVSNAVTSFEYEEDEKKTDQLKLTIENQDLRWFDTPLFEKGTVLVVTWGYAGNLSPLREVVVQSVKGSLSLTIEAQDKGVLMNKVTRSRAFENVTRAEVVRRIADENGYGAEQQHIDDGTLSTSAAEMPRYAVISQAAQTDAAFLKKLADLQGFEFFIDIDGLHWHPRKVGQKPVREYVYYLDGTGSIMSFDVNNDVLSKPGSVAVKGTDPLTKQEVGAVGSDSTTPRDTLAEDIEIIDPASGASSLQSPAATNTASSDTRPTTETSAAGAKVQAAGIFTRGQQSAVELDLSMIGDPSLLAKTVIKVSGLGKRLSGRYYASNITHTVGSGGYTMKLKTKTDGTNGTGGVAKSSAANPNTKNPDADGAGDGGLTEIEVIDPASGASSTTYSDTRGRE